MLTPRGVNTASRDTYTGCIAHIWMKKSAKNLIVIPA